MILFTLLVGCSNVPKPGAYDVTEVQFIEDACGYGDYLFAGLDQLSYGNQLLSVGHWGDDWFFSLNGLEFGCAEGDEVLNCFVDVDGTQSFSAILRSPRQDALRVHLVLTDACRVGGCEQQQIPESCSVIHDLRGKYVSGGFDLLGSIGATGL